MNHRCLLEIDCRIKPEKRREFRLNIGTSLQGSSKMRGRAFVYEDQNEPGHILIVEEWASLDQLTAYLASDDFLSMVGGFKVLGVLHDCRVVNLISSDRVARDQTPMARNLNGWSPVDIDSGGKITN